MNDQRYIEEHELDFFVISTYFNASVPIKPFFLLYLSVVFSGPFLLFLFRLVLLAANLVDRLLIQRFLINFKVNVSVI